MRDLLARLRNTYQALTPLADGFYPPDAPPNYTPYGCSYHWFRGPDGRAISLDVIRSDDTGRLGLRVVRERRDGGVDGLSHFDGREGWLPMRADGQLDGEAETRPLLSRSQHAIAGRVIATAATERQGLQRVRFALTLQPRSPGYGTGQLGLGLSHLVATDFLNVHYRGFVELDGEVLNIDAVGSISLHAGDKLPQYGYLIGVPPLEGPSAPRLLAAAVHGDSLRVGEELLEGRTMGYAYGEHGMPPISLHVGEFGREIPLGLGGRIELAGIRPFFHDFLGEPTCTAAVQARYVPLLGPPIDLGRVFIDYRGRYFLSFLDGDTRREEGSR